MGSSGLASSSNYRAVVMTLVKIVFLSLSVAALSVSAASTMVFKKIEVQMGAVGSDDDIRVKICDNSKCCTTKVLSNLLSGEWRAKKKETWDGSKLGNCSQILFDDKLSSVEVTILKDGKRVGPEVSGLVLSGQVGTDKKNLQSFQCGGYRFSASDRQKSNSCSNLKSSRPPSSSSTMVFKKGKDKMLIDNFFIQTVNNQGLKRRFKGPRFSVDREKVTQECYTQFAKPRPTTTSRTGPCLRSGRNCPSSTTTRAPFRSGSG